MAHHVILRHNLEPSDVGVHAQASITITHAIVVCLTEHAVQAWGMRPAGSVSPANAVPPNITENTLG